MGEICTEVQFLKDVSKHQMIVLRDDGISRHIRFKQPNTGNRYFDLITWDGCLCYNGDMGTFVFSRIPDMFEFFRQDRSQVLRDGKTLAINLGYWGEKLQSISRFGGYEEFDGDKFKQVINEYRIQWMRDMKDADDSKEDRRELWEAVDDYVKIHRMGSFYITDNTDATNDSDVCASWFFVKEDA